MNIFTSYKEWFINTMEPIIQVSIIKYDISQYRLMRNKIQRYEQKMERLETPEEKQKMMNIIEVSKLQLNAFPTLRSMYDELNKIFKYRPFKEQFNKNSFQLKEQMTNIQKRKFDLLRWIRNSERSLFQLLQMELIKNNNGRSIRQKRNENHSREELKNNWLRLVLNVSSENIRQAYQRKNKRKNRNSQLLKSYNYGLKQNNFNLSLNGKKKHLKINECSYDFEERTDAEKIEFLDEIERKKRNNDNFSGRYDWEETLDMLGINQLSFLKINEHNTFQNRVKKENLKKALIKLINLYLMPIQENYTDVFLLYRENIMMCISFILYDDNISKNNYLNIFRNFIEIGEGSFGKTSKKKNNNNKIYKKENLRIMTSYERKEKLEESLFKKYPINSYVSSQVLFSYMIQKYLYNLNNNYVPDIDDIHFFYNENKDLNNENIEIKSITKMNNAKITKNRNEILKSYSYSMNLNEIIFDTKIKLYHKSNFIKFILKILMKICDILIYYQTKCFFIHRDLHPYNIIVNFNLTSNNIDIENFQVKLIDFSFTSIIINNNNNVMSQLQFTNLRPHWDCKFLNPLLNKEWQKVDLKYFFLFTFFNSILYGLSLNKGNYNDIFHLSQIEFLENIFAKLLNIKDGFKERFNDFHSIGCFNKVKRFDMFYKKNVLYNIFQINIDDENIFYPSNCKKNINDYLNRYIK